MRRAPIVDKIEFSPIEETDGVDHKLAVLVMADGFAEPGRLGIARMRHVQIDAAHFLLALPDDPDLFRRLDEEDGLGREQQLARRAARPTARLRGEGTVAVEHILVVLPHHLFGPRLQIGVLRIGHTLHDAALIALSDLWIGRVEADRSELSRDGAEIDAAIEQPAGIGEREVGNGAFLSSGACGDNHRNRSDKRRAAQQRFLQHFDAPPLRGL